MSSLRKVLKKHKLRKKVVRMLNIFHQQEKELKNGNRTAIGVFMSKRKKFKNKKNASN